MTKRRWTAEDDAELLRVIDYVIGQGGMIRTAFELYASDFNRTYEAAKRRYFDIKPDDAADLRIKGNQNPLKVNQKPIITAVKETHFIHPALLSVSDHIQALEAQNEALRATIDNLWNENKVLTARITEAEKCEAELNHLLSIINRSRKEAFAADVVPRKYKVVDGIPVFES